MALTTEQTRELRQLVEGRRTSLLAELRDDLAKARGDSPEELAGTARDAGDESVATLIADLDRAEVARDVGELRELDAARARMAEGLYGVCIECERDIDFARLRANPGALRCIECQERFEKTHPVITRTTL
jgi:DnaK suppressor protein